MRQLGFVFALLVACAPATPTPLAGAERQTALDAYVAQFQEDLMKHWKPKAALDTDLDIFTAAGDFTSVVWVLIDQQGSVLSTVVAQSARGSFDREAIRAVITSGPFPPPPEGLLYRSSRGLMAAIPLSFTVPMPGEPGQQVQVRRRTIGVPVKPPRLSGTF